MRAHRRRTFVELEDAFAAALDSHPHAVHARPRQDLHFVALHVRRDDAVDAELDAHFLAPARGELGELAQRDGHEAVVVEEDRLQIRMDLQRRLHLADDVVDAAVPDLAVVGVVGDEDGVAAVRAVQRAADRPDRGIGEAVVVEVVAARDRAKAFLRLVNPFRAAVLRIGHRSQLRRRHQRPERIAFDLAARAILEPEAAGLREVAAVLEVMQPLGERELALARTDRVHIRLDGILGIDDRMDPAPHRVRLRIQLAHARGQLFGEVGVAGHRGEGDDVGVSPAHARSHRPRRAPNDRPSPTFRANDFHIERYRCVPT